MSRSLVLGTAGHIDHGKTTLVQALTGVDTDRLPHEKQRGITIELGFAAFEVAPGLETSIVDVPGHENFVRTMVAGAGGIDAVIVVVSAEEGVMPQTREHLNVCRLLGLQRGVVALTMIDRLEGDPETIALATEDVRAELADTPLAAAPVIPCSGVTGEGIDTLRQAIADMVETLPARSVTGPPILPLDRVFSLRGHGTVVTGTLIQGAIDLGHQASLMLVPEGEGREPRTTRIREMQVRGRASERAEATCRVALNLAAIDVDELSRGDVLTRGPGVVRARLVHAEVSHLAHGAKPWRWGTALQVSAGASHAVGRVVPLREPGVDDLGIPPGSHALVALRLEVPLPVWYGQRLVLRDFNAPIEVAPRPVEDAGRTVGGGRIVDPLPSTGRKQRRHWATTAVGLAQADPRQRLHAVLAEAGGQGMDAQTLIVRTGIEKPAAILGDDDEVQALPGDRWVAADTLQPLVDAAVERMDAFHGEHPLQAGLGRAALERTLAERAAIDVATLAVDLALERGLLVATKDTSGVARPGRGLEAMEQWPPRIQQVLEAYQAAGLRPPTVKDLQARFQMSEAEVLEALGLLQQADALVRVTSSLSLARQAHDALIDRVRRHLQTHGEIDVQALKELTGLSRKFAVPLLEHLDRLQITRRRGDLRVPGHRA